MAAAGLVCALAVALAGCGGSHGSAEPGAGRPSGHAGSLTVYSDLSVDGPTGPTGATGATGAS